MVEEDIKKCKVEETLAHYYMDEGHPFYSMTLTMQDDSKVCWVFDAKTALWHNRSLNNITAVTTFGGETLIGLDNDDAIHASRLSFGTDADTSIRRIAQSPILFEDLKRLRIEHVEIDIPNPQSMGFEDSDTIMLEWSDDEGRTWNAVSTKRLNQPRLRWNRMGQTREGRLLRMTVNSNKPILILGTYLAGQRWEHLMPIQMSPIQRGTPESEREQILDQMERMRLAMQRVAVWGRHPSRSVL